VTLSSSDVAAIRSAEKALAEAFEASDPTAWVGYYTEATFPNTLARRRLVG
jgi:hypothetical protein